MITKEQAIYCGEHRHLWFHFSIGTLPCENWRANGKCKTWKTRPEKFSLPIKYGLFQYSYLTEADANLFHTEEQCPNKAKKGAK